MTLETLTELPAILRAAMISINTTALCIQKNSDLILSATNSALEAGVELALFPELCLTGYGAEDVFLSKDFIEETSQALIKLCHLLPEDIYIAIGMPLLFGENCYNVMALISHGHIHGFSAKQNMAKSGIHYEPRWFCPWPGNTVERIQFHGFNVPIGALTFDYRENSFCFEICEDAWVRDRVACQFSATAPAVILNASASHFALGKYDRRQKLVIEGSQLYKGAYLYCNLLGCEAGRSIYDGGNLYAYNGKLELMGERFSFHDFYIDFVDCPYPKRNTNEINEGIFLPDCKKSNKKTLAQPQEGQAFNAYEEVSNAIMLGLWDWSRKTKTKGYTLSLSGGADSGLCAAMVYLTHKKALLTLSQEVYLAKTGIEFVGALSIESVMKQVLTTVYQATRYSSEETKSAASELAANIHCAHSIWQIDDLVLQYENLVKLALGMSDNELNQDDLAKQNIQARTRAPGIWMIANLKQQLLLATSNLSEACVGYCTMDGDTAGVLSPISGLSKSFVLALNETLVNKGIRISLYLNDCLSVKGLKKTTHLSPSAELREDVQRDEEDLMPYEVLDEISRLIHISHCNVKTIKNRILQISFSTSYSKETLIKYVDKFFALYQRSQWKRERLAPGFHLQEDSCCPKTYRRYPILN